MLARRPERRCIGVRLTLELGPGEVGGKAVGAGVLESAELHGPAVDDQMRDRVRALVDDDPLDGSKSAAVGGQNVLSDLEPSHFDSGTGSGAESALTSICRRAASSRSWQIFK